MAGRRPLMSPLVSRVVGIVSIVAIAAAVTLTGLRGCDDSAGDDVLSVKLGPTWYHLELAATAEKRFRGLSGRTDIPADGGMFFVFRQPIRELYFVMRDCPVDIDIIFLDGGGRIVAMHEMKPDPPRGPEEQPIPDPDRPDWAWTNPDYEDRLTRYQSRFPGQFVVELRGGQLRNLGLKEGDRVPIAPDRLKALAESADP